MINKARLIYFETNLNLLLLIIQILKTHYVIIIIPANKNQFILRRKSQLNPA